MASMKTHLLSRAALAATVLIPLAACTPMKNVRGDIVENDQLARIQTGVDTRTDVLRKIGTPTTKAPFDDKTWYYMGQDTEKRGILDPKITKERIVEVHFNDQGIVDLAQLVNNKRNDVPYVRDKTPTSGSEMTMMQQFLGNLGRFNTDQMQKGHAGAN
jgi:outer membrane protein assembly factor BamE (lipoprotein component of BamABCDE complex)